MTQRSLEAPLLRPRLRRQPCQWRPLERFPAKHALGLDPWVDTGSRQENASNQESRAPFRFHRSGKGSSAIPPRQHHRVADFRHGPRLRFFVIWFRHLGLSLARAYRSHDCARGVHLPLFFMYFRRNRLRGLVRPYDDCLWHLSDVRSGRQSRSRTSRRSGSLLTHQRLPAFLTRFVRY